MKYLFAIILFVSSCSIKMNAQFSTQTDSVFTQLNLKFSPEALSKAKSEYELANDTLKAIMRKVYSMPMVSRKDMIENFEERKEDIMALKDEFCDAIPKGYIVSLDVEMGNDFQRSVKSIDIQIYRKDGKWRRELVDAEWGVEFNSSRFYDLIHQLDWDVMTFSNIKNFMQMANCMSIKNDENIEIGFARSGLGKYSYIMFPSNLSENQALIYDDGCKYKFYKDNIVLKYEGGMAGPQCFTD